MTMTLRLLTAAAVVAAGFAAISPFGAAGAAMMRSSVERPMLVEIPPGSFSYREAGEFTDGRRSVKAPSVRYRFEDRLFMTRHQVTVVEYLRCVAAGACKKLAAEADLTPYSPVVQVSWLDATDYAVWLSAHTGETYRLPTDEEWAYAAGSRFSDDGVGLGDDPTDPSRDWLDRYDRAAASEGLPDSRPRPVGSFGANERGLLDIAGNVWEWTNTCFTRRFLGQAGRAAAPVVNCGVRVVEGRHRGYVPNFIRDARAGGCSTGKPPANLGFRLVREPEVGLHATERSG